MFTAIQNYTPKFALVAAIFIAVPTSVCTAVEIEGFTEPNRTVNVATPDQGIVVSVPVQIGDFVKKNQVIAKLDDKIQVIQLEAARERKDARGRLIASEAEVKLKASNLSKLRELKGSGFGRSQEVARAATDLEIAQAEVQAVKEDLADKALQYRKLQAELRRRIIYSPLSGYISDRHKEPGEYVAPNEPNLVTIVELDPLLAKFSMKRSLARHVKLGSSVNVLFEDLGKSVIGTVQQVSPVLDAQSGTIKVKVQISNKDGMFLSGQRCSIDVRVDGEPENDLLDIQVRPQETSAQRPMEAQRR